MVRSNKKVTAFITRRAANQVQLLLLKHPYAGIQIPAGTVESGETPAKAVLREVFEETGLLLSSPCIYLGSQQTQLPSDQAIILPPATVFARPDLTSFDWIRIRSAVQVEVRQTVPGFTQISYIEYDQVPKPNFISMQIIGWISNEYLAQGSQRYFFHLEFQGDSIPSWEIFSDHHTFSLFWSPLKNLPSIIPPQDTWIEYLLEYFKEDE